MKTFWIVYRPGHGTTSRETYNTLAEATDAAVTLQTDEPAKSGYVVMKSVKVAKTLPVSVELVQPED